jgi:hypothetical protein
MNNNILDKIDFKSIFDSMKIVDCSVNLRYKAFHNINGPAIIRKNNYKEWYYLGKLHRKDGPAVEGVNGHYEWYKNGKLHRENGPAIDYDNGELYYYRNNKLHSYNDMPCIDEYGHQKWYKNGKLHRENGPAIIKKNGSKYWYFYGNRHSYNDQPAVIKNDGTLKWYKYGKLHREDGPAIIINKENDLNNSIWIHKNFLYNVHKLWIQNDLIHNQNGHAVEYKNGNKQWYLNNELHRINGPANLVNLDEERVLDEENNNDTLETVLDISYELEMYYINGKEIINDYKKVVFYIKKFINKILKVKRKKIFNKVNNIVIKNKDLSNLISNYF